MSSKLKTLLVMEQHEQVHLGESGAEVYFLPARNAYLKIGAREGLTDLERERDVFMWLDGRANVPLPIDFESTNTHEYLLLSAIPGLPYCDVLANLTDHQEILGLVEVVAAEIRAMHEISIENCPFDQSAGVKLGIAQRNIDSNLLPEADIIKENNGKNSAQIISELRASRPASEDLVFTHGDLCLPNIMIADGRVSGFIDMALAGAADRYSDIGIFLRSFSHNAPFEIDIDDAFCRGYGLDRLDREKVEYFQLLDELF